ncbi:hypothetical protein KJ780_00525 [Candidatus Micrarchaeota archaeon]|nr:hypothetical protein [Candidatus Micrarchaeota archaeon]
MITKIRVLEIHAQRPEEIKRTGFEVLFNMEDAKVEGDLVKVGFSYVANYPDGNGSIQIKGILHSQEDAETIKKIEDGLKSKKLPPDYMQKLVNTVNYLGTTSATVVASVMNMSPPMKLPALVIGEKKNDKEKEKKK